MPAEHRRVMPDFTISPNEQPIFNALLDAGVKATVAYTAVRRIRELAAHNIASVIKSLFDAQNAKFDAQIAGLRWMMGAVLALMAIIVTLLGIIVAQSLSSRATSAPPPAPVVNQLPPPATPGDAPSNEVSAEPRGQ